MMKQERSRLLTAALLFVCGALFWCRAVWLSGGLPSADSFYLLYSQEQTLSPAAPFSERGKYNYAAIRQSMNEPVEAPLFRRNTSLTVLEISGNPSLALSFQPMLEGVMPSESDGCAIDKQTALLLWGDPDALGQTVLYDEKEYTVTGVFRSKVPMMVTCPGGELSFQHALFAPSPNASFPLAGLHSFLTSEGLPSPALQQNTQERTALYRTLSFLPALIPAGALLLVLVRHLFPKSRLFRRCAWIAGMLLAAFLLGIRLPLPARFLPTRWSDFSFWPALVKELREAALLRYTQPALVTDYLLRTAYLRPIVLCSAMAALLFALSVHIAASLEDAYDETSD